MERSWKTGLDRWLTTPPEPEEWCDVCGLLVDDCVCPLCPLCDDQGNPACYQEVDLGVCGGLYGKETTAQKIGKAEAQIKELQSQIADLGEYIWNLQCQDENEREEGEKK